MRRVNAKERPSPHEGANDTSAKWLEHGLLVDSDSIADRSTRIRRACQVHSANLLAAGAIDLRGSCNHCRIGARMPFTRAP